MADSAEPNTWILRILSKEVAMKEKRHIPWFLWPLRAIWKLLTLVLGLTGRLIGVILGLVMVITGIVACLSIIGVAIGIPLIVLGFLLMLRSIF